MRIRRRDFLALAGGVLASPAFAQRDQIGRRSGHVPLIAALVTATKAQSDIDTLAPFLKGLAMLGLVEGSDYAIVAEYMDGDTSRFPIAAKQLVGLNPDVILATSSTAAAVVAQATSTIPILAVPLASSEIDSLVVNMGRPTGNVTGILTDFVSLTGKHCDLALELVPSARRIGVLVYAPGVTTAEATRQTVRAAADAKGFSAVLVDVSVPNDIGPGFRALADAMVDVAIVGTGSVFSSDRGRTAAAAAVAKLPTIYNEQGYVEAGGLISYGFDRKAGYVRAATYAQRLLSGTKPPDLPVEQTQTYLLAVNRAAAASLVLAFPSTILFRADEVV